MDLEGRLLGNRYEIIEKIGNGGMAMVYKAKCHVLNRYVAVKILRDEFTTDQEFIKRFEIEAQAAASITHPNIVSVYDVGKDGNLYYIVMELVQGKTLKEIIIEENGPLPWKWSVNIAIQIASALEIAHKNNIVHRDIKPHNIIITEDGTAKVTDFGIAKAVSNSTITAFGTTIGSVHYFSPEHARGGYTDAKSDLYSLGVVMYEMITGRVPFDADTPVSVALKHMQEEPIEPKKLNENVPQALNDIVLKAMRKDINLRYQNATQMLNDLRRVLKEPNGEFVDNDEYEEDMPTQKISIKDIKEAESKEKHTEKKQNKFIRFINNHKGFSIFIGLILLFMISIGGTVLISRLTNPKEVLMPNVVGINKDEAERTLKESGLILEVTAEEYSGEYAQGYIISQDPQFIENYNIKAGETIKVVVSKGIEEAVVPNVVGKTREEAEKLLTDSKLKVEVVEEENKKIEAGYVVSQETAENTKVFAGDTVVIHVSTGIKKSAIPSVLGKSEEEAKNTLTGLGLKVTVVYDEDSSKENGTVLKQSIDVGKEVEEGTEITITVNKVTETKSATLTVNVKSLLGGKVEYEEPSTNTANGTSSGKTVKDVKVKILVGTDTVYNESIDPTTTNLVQTIFGKGTVIVKVYIDDVLKKQTDVNFNTTDKLTIE